MQKFKTQDKIKVLTGRDRGREGVIEKLFPKKGVALVPGINTYKKHIKKQMARDGKGGVYELSRPIALSKITHMDPKDSKKATRIGFRMEGDKKVRIAKKSNSIFEIKK